MNRKEYEYMMIYDPANVETAPVDPMDSTLRASLGSSVRAFALETIRSLCQVGGLCGSLPLHLLAALPPSPPGPSAGSLSMCRHAVGDVGIRLLHRCRCLRLHVFFCDVPLLTTSRRGWRGGMMGEPYATPGVLPLLVVPEISLQELRSMGILEKEAQGQFVPLVDDSARSLLQRPGASLAVAQMGCDDRVHSTPEGDTAVRIRASKA